MYKINESTCEEFYSFTRAEINLDNLLFNYSQLKKFVGDKKKIIAVVKADAYGHGVEAIRFLQKNGIDLFAVSSLNEAITLRRNGITVDIMLLSNTPERCIPALVKWNIQPCVYQYDFAKALSDYCVKTKCTIQIHIKVDTGMKRIGWDWRNATEPIANVCCLPGLIYYGLFTHLADAENSDNVFTREQLLRFDFIISSLKEKGIEFPLIHVENSAAIVNYGKTKYNGIRPGDFFYGLVSYDDVKYGFLKLKPVMNLKTNIIDIKTVHKGESVGYERAYIADSDRRIATLPIGYVDGYRRKLSENNGEVMVRGKRAPLVGIICMDQCMIDITEIPESQLWDEVELFGENISVNEIAEKSETNNCDIICTIHKRIPRVYICNEKKYIGEEIDDKE